LTKTGLVANASPASRSQTGRGSRGTISVLVYAFDYRRGEAAITASLWLTMTPVGACPPGEKPRRLMAGTLA
jgi:hypothetical protein